MPRDSTEAFVGGVFAGLGAGLGFVLTTSVMARLPILTRPPPPPPPPPPNPVIFTIGGGGRNLSIFKVIGLHWQPNIEVELKIIGEPQRDADGELTTGPWRSLGKVATDWRGSFGELDDGFRFSVPRTICGTPPAMAPALLMGVDQVNNKFAFHSINPASWFTFEPCD